MKTTQMLAVLSMARALLRHGSSREYVIGMTAVALETSTDIVADLLDRNDKGWDEVRL